MKVNFNKDGMTINFDKVPRFIYINEEGIDVGQVYFDGVRRKGLQKVKIQAQTRDEKSHYPLQYSIQYIEAETKGTPQFISNMEDRFSVCVKLTGLKVFERLVTWAKDIMLDKRIPQTVRQSYCDQLSEIISTGEDE